jgi:hypothetical protein
MALTKKSKEIKQTRVRVDRAFRDVLLRKGVESMLGGDAGSGRAYLKVYIDATMAFRQLGTEAGA